MHFSQVNVVISGSPGKPTIIYRDMMFRCMYMILVFHEIDLKLMGIQVEQ